MLHMLHMLHFMLSLYEVHITFCQETIIFEFRIIDVSKNYL